jgi:hypothetical protein
MTSHLRGELRDEGRGLGLEQACAFQVENHGPRVTAASFQAQPDGGCSPISCHHPEQGLSC